MHQLEHRVPVVETVAVEIGVGPHVLAHRHSDADALESEWPRIRPRLEVSGLVENVVGGQETFEVALHHLSSVAQRHRVVETLAGSRLVAVDKAHQDAEIVIREMCDALELGEVAIDKIPPFQKVPRRIADGGELGENHEIGRFATCPFDSNGHRLEIGLEGANRVVELGNGNAHWRSFPEAKDITGRCWGLFATTAVKG